MELLIKHYKLADLHPAQYNPRQDGVIEEQLNASLDEFGLLEPIVVNLRTSPEYPEAERIPTIVGGHQRYYALLKRGVTETDAVLVVGEIRDKKTGFYRNFVQDTIQILQNAGARYYNELILATALASAPLRARNTFKKRKPVKVHQNVILAYKGDPIQKAHEQVLTFYKGNPDLIPEIYGSPYTEDELDQLEE